MDNTVNDLGPAKPSSYFIKSVFQILSTSCLFWLVKYSSALTAIIHNICLLFIFIAMFGIYMRLPNTSYKLLWNFIYSMATASIVALLYFPILQG